VGLATLACVSSCASSGASGQPARATFAGGCFWCMEEPFEKVPGVLSVVSGFSGGTKPNPTYRDVSAGGTGYAESVDVAFDPARVSYERLLDVYWHNVDPLTAGGQFCDKGSQYRSAIFFRDDAQKRAAEESKARIASELGAPVATEIVPFMKFYAAESSHQDFYKTNPGRYHEYVEGCGRHRRLAQLWGDSAGVGAAKP
jgi:peptide-methionine (S)-S-oxide reductase